MGFTAALLTEPPRNLLLKMVGFVALGPLVWAIFVITGAVEFYLESIRRQSNKK